MLNVMSSRMYAIFVAACFTLAPSWPLKNTNDPNGDGGLILKIRSPMPGQIWLPSIAVQVHVNVDVTEGPAADSVRLEAYAYELCYHGGGTEPPQCKPLIEGNRKTMPVHYTEEGVDKGSETQSIWAVAEPNGLATVTAWLQRIESSQLAHPAAALAPPATVHLWENATAAAIEFQCWLSIPNHEDTTEEKVDDMNCAEAAGRVPPLKPLIDPSERAAIFNHLGFALLDNHRFAESAHAFYCVEAIQRSISSGSGTTVKAGSSSRVQGDIPSECSPGYATSAAHSMSMRAEGTVLSNAGCNTFGSSLQANECRAATVLQYAPCVGEASVEAAVALGLDEVLAALCRQSDDEADEVTNASPYQNTKASRSESLREGVSSPHKKLKDAQKMKSDKPLLVIMVGNGLSNRLRAVASAVLLARRSHRRLVLLWPLEAHCRAHFSDLFNGSSLAINKAYFVDEIDNHGVNNDDDDESPLVVEFPLDYPPDVVDDFFASLAIKGSKQVNTYIYSFWNSPVMNLGVHDSTHRLNGGLSSNESLLDPSLVENHGAHHAYARSSYWLVSQDHGDTRLGGGSDEAMRAVLKHIFAASSTTVGATLAREQARVTAALKSTSIIPSQQPLQRLLVAVHIRMQANMSKDVPSPPAHMATEMEMLGETARLTREACAPPSFMVAMRKLQSTYRANGYQVVFYIASDVPEAVTTLQAAFAPGVVLGYDGHLCRTRSESNSSHRLRRDINSSRGSGDSSSSSGSDSGGGYEEDMTRSSACFQRALIEQIMLTDERVVTRVISHWSTFSEVVSRVAPLSAVPVVSGCGHRQGDLLGNPKPPQLSALPVGESSSERFDSNGTNSSNGDIEAVTLTASEMMAVECAAGKCVVAYALPACEEDWLKATSGDSSSNNNEGSNITSSEAARDGAVSTEKWPGEFAASFAGARALARRLVKVAANSSPGSKDEGSGSGDGLGRFGSQYPFAHWQMRLYHACPEGTYHPNGLLKELATAGVELVNVSHLDTPHRYHLNGDGDIKHYQDNKYDHEVGIDRFVARGLHSGLLTRRDEASVSAWAMSGLACHAVRVLNISNKIYTSAIFKPRKAMVRDHPHHFGIESILHTRDSWRGNGRSPPPHHRWAAARGALASMTAAISARTTVSQHHSEFGSFGTHSAAQFLAGVGAQAWPQCRELGLLLHDSWVPAPISKNSDIGSQSSSMNAKLVSKEAPYWVNDLGDWPESLDGRGAPWRINALDLNVEGLLGEWVVQQPLPWLRDASGLDFVGRTVNAEGTWRAEEVLALQSPRPSAARISGTEEYEDLKSGKFGLVPWPLMTTSSLPLARTDSNTTSMHKSKSSTVQVWALTTTPDIRSSTVSSINSNKNGSGALRVLSPLEGAALDLDSRVQVIVDWLFDPAAEAFISGSGSSSSGMWHICACLVGSRDVGGIQKEYVSSCALSSEEDLVSEQCTAADDSAGPRFVFQLAPPQATQSSSLKDDLSNENFASTSSRPTPLQYCIEASLRFYRWEDIPPQDTKIPKAPESSSVSAARTPASYLHEYARVGVGFVKS